MSNYVCPLCPFYIRESQKSMTCEGFLTEESFTTTKFETEAQKFAYQRVYCWRENWSKCVLAVMLNKKYEDK